MLTTSREQDLEIRKQAVRLLLASSRQHLVELAAHIDQLPTTIDVPALRNLKSRIDQAICDCVAEHARLDLDLLLSAGKKWKHPVQALARPRAPYSAVVDVCACRLEEERGKPAKQRLQRIHKRLLIAREVDESARQRRMAINSYRPGPEPNSQDPQTSPSEASAWADPQLGK